MDVSNGIKEEWIPVFRENETGNVDRRESRKRGRMLPPKSDPSKRRGPFSDHGEIPYPATSTDADRPVTAHPSGSAVSLQTRRHECPRSGLGHPRTPPTERCPVFTSGRTPVIRSRSRHKGRIHSLYASHKECPVYSIGHLSKVETGCISVGSSPRKAHTTTYGTSWDGII